MHYPNPPKYMTGEPDPTDTHLAFVGKTKGRILGSGLRVIPCHTNGVGSDLGRVRTATRLDVDAGGSIADSWGYLDFLN